MVSRLQRFLMNKIKGAARQINMGRIEKVRRKWAASKIADNANKAMRNFMFNLSTAMSPRGALGLAEAVS